MLNRVSVKTGLHAGLILIFLLSFSSVVYSLDYEKSLISTDTEGDRAFPLIKAQSISGNEYENLLDNDNGSSGWIFLHDGKETLSPFDDGWTRKTYTDGKKKVIKYNNRFFDLTMTSEISDSGVYALVTTDFTNNSGDTVKIEPALLLDTFLGEPTGIHFVTGSGTLIQNEIQFDKSEIPDWISSQKDKVSPSLTIFFKSDFSEKPEKIIAANWLLLKQSGFNFEYEKNRSFDNLPFSANDSALFIRYSEHQLKKGESFKIKVLFGINSALPDSKAFSGSSEENKADIQSQNIKLRKFTLERRLAELNSLIDRIDLLLKEESINETAAEEIQKQLEYQEKLKAEYENL